MILFLLFFFKEIVLNESVNKCVNCRFFLKPIPPLSSEFSKCILYPKYNLDLKELKEKKKKDYIDLLVSGYDKKSKYFDIDYHYCCYARNSEKMCGKEGRNFKPFNFTPHPPSNYGP